MLCQGGWVERSRVVLLLALAGFGNVPRALGGNFTWATYVDLPYSPNGQVGLTALNGRLILTWGDQSSNYLEASTSEDGRNWSTPVVLNGFPQVYNDVANAAPPPYASGGVNMTTSTGCGYAYVAYTDPTGDEIYGARSQDGVSWDGGHLIWSVKSYTGAPGTASPALNGEYLTNAVAFAFPSYSGGALAPYGGTPPSSWASTDGYEISTGQFNCDFSSPQLTSSCFLWDSATKTCQDSQATPGYGSVNNVVALEFDEGPLEYDPATGPWSPLWTGPPGNDLRAVAQGNPLANAEPPVYYSVGEGVIQCVSGISPCPPSSYSGDGATWTNNGLGGAVQPGTGVGFVFKTCQPFYSNIGGANSACYNTHPLIQAWYLPNHRESSSGNWSYVAPAATFFNGALWVAACGENNCLGGITVMSVYPAQLTGCAYSLSQLTMYMPGSGASASDAVSTGTNNCVWSASSDSSWISITGGADMNGSGQFTFSAAQNNSGGPISGVITAADNQKVTVYQGTLGGSPGTGSVTTYGSPTEQTINECPPENCWETLWEYGTVSATVNGQTFTVNHGGPDWTSDSLASSLASEIDSQPPYSAVSATVSGPTVTITSPINGANTNYALSASWTYGSGFSGPAATASASGPSLTGGAN